MTWWLQSPATMPIIVLRAESDELSTVRTELTGGKKFIAVATHLDLFDPEVGVLPAEHALLPFLLHVGWCSMHAHEYVPNYIACYALLSAS